MISSTVSEYIITSSFFFEMFHDNENLQNNGTSINLDKSSIVGRITKNASCATKKGNRRSFHYRGGYLQFYQNQGFNCEQYNTSSEEGKNFAYIEIISPNGNNEFCLQMDTSTIYQCCGSESSRKLKGDNSDWNSIMFQRTPDLKSASLD
jgi:hypothetical protein